MYSYVYSACIWFYCKLCITQLLSIAAADYWTLKPHLPPSGHRQGFVQLINQKTHPLKHFLPLIPHIRYNPHPGELYATAILIVSMFLLQETICHICIHYIIQGRREGVSMGSGNPLSNSVHTAKLASVTIHAYGFNF